MLDVLFLPNPLTIFEFDFVHFCWLQLNVSHLPWESTISREVFQTNSSSCEIMHYGKCLIAIFRDFYASINKVIMLVVGLGTRLSFYEV